MAKVFRLHTAGADTINDWGISNQYNSTIIHSIPDPAGASARREITSIPSPFARMDLVKEAFAFVNKIGHDGDTIHHKMVSHALDVAQIFYNFNNFRQAGLIELIKWDTRQVETLQNSGYKAHKLLGRTYELFMQSDAEQFNFDSLNGIYLLHYIGPGAPNPMTIIGATSPASLFFTSANDHSYLNGSINFDNHKALANNDFQSLKNRADHGFIEWMYALRKAIPEFARRFPQVDEYLNKAYGVLPHDLQMHINAMDNDSLHANYDPLDIEIGVPVEILGVQLGLPRQQPIDEISDFAIKSDKVTSNRPLVLPSDKFAYPWHYVNANWSPDIEVPLYPGELGKRTLPTLGVPWPYLTMTDFLEDTLIMTESNPVSTDFFNGNLTDNAGGDHSFLLPIKKKYFEYFTAEDLKKNLSMVCDTAPAGGLKVTVTLKIPVSKGEIEYRRIYLSDSSVMNPKNGAILTRDFTLVLFPRTRFADDAKPDYVTGILSMNDDWSPRLECVTEEGRIITPELGPSDRNRDNNGKRINHAAPIMPMSSISQNFDFMQLTDGDKSGIAIPMWSGMAGMAIYEFAVDFGTTNTHIEYKRTGENQSHALDIPKSARQLATFNEDAQIVPQYKVALRNNSIPTFLGEGEETHFPMRTLLSYKQSTDWNQAAAPYITGNMPFYYGMIAPAPYDRLNTDLKWSTEADNTAMVKCYLGSLIHIIRNKVVMEGGDLARTRIRWFYPTSMPTPTVNSISSIWSDLYTKHIGPNEQENLVAIPESIAPFHFYRNNFGNCVDVLTIDIGGGTSDAFIVDKYGRPAFITSFRFAANSLIGDGFAKAGLQTNGFVTKYRPKFNDILTSNNLQNVMQILEDVAATGISADYLSLLFGLKNNSDVIRTKCEDKVDFNRMLQNSEGARTLVLIFYTALIYHMARFIKAKREAEFDIQEPAILAFSGNGSKLLQVLGVKNRTGLDMLRDYTKAVFEKVNGISYPHASFRLVIDPDKPKESTCKGGLLTQNAPSTLEINRMKDTLLGISGTDFLKTRNNLKYSDLTQQDIQGLDTEIKNFTEIFYQLADELDLPSSFGTIDLNKLDQLRPLFESGVENRANNAMTALGVLNTPKKVEDTLFFYPITALLNELAQQIL